MSYTNEAYIALQKAGWFPGRLIDIARIREALTIDGYIMNDVVAEFLEEFGDLEIEFPNCASTRDFMPIQRLSFRTIDATNEFFPENAIVYREKCHEDLVIVGEAYVHLSIFVSNTEKFYGGYDNVFCFIGDGKYEAINRLIACTKFEKID